MTKDPIKLLTKFLNDLNQDISTDAIKHTDIKYKVFEYLRSNSEMLTPTHVEIAFNKVYHAYIKIPTQPSLGYQEEIEVKDNPRIDKSLLPAYYSVLLGIILHFQCRLPQTDEVINNALVLARSDHEEITARIKKLDEQIESREKLVEESLLELQEAYVHPSPSSDEKAYALLARAEMIREEITAWGTELKELRSLSDEMDQQLVVLFSAKNSHHHSVKSQKKN